MSAIFARILLSVGLGVASVVIYTFWKSSQREEHSHHQGHRNPGGGAGTASGYWEPPPSWRDDDSDDDDTERRRRRRRLTSGSSTTTASSSASIHNGCCICIETFENLKKKGTPIWTTPCGHLFCKPCLERAIQVTAACPSCREPVNFRNCHKIHL